MRTQEEAPVFDDDVATPSPYDDVPDEATAQVGPTSPRPAHLWVSGILLILLAVPAVLTGFLFIAMSGLAATGAELAGVIALAILIMACAVVGAWMWFQGARESSHPARWLWWGTTVAALPALVLVGWILTGP